MSRNRRGERGQVLVIVAGGIMALLIFLGLIIDGGNAFLNRRTAQNTADITALDATSLIATGYKSGTAATQQAVYAQVVKSVAVNDCSSTDSTPCTWQAWYVGRGVGGPADITPVSNTSGALPTNANGGTIGVRVAVRRLPGTFLARLANIQTWDVNSDATAIAQSPTNAPAGQLLPIGVSKDATCGASANESCYTPGQVWDLTDGKDAPGGFGWLSWSGAPDANTLWNSICTPNNPTFTLPAQITGSSGTSNDVNVRACLDKWIASGQTILIPIYSVVTGVGHPQYTIVAIASFVLTSYGQPAVDNIRGYFVGVDSLPGGTVPGGIGSGGPPVPGDTSIFMSLVK